MAHTETFDPKRYTPYEPGLSPERVLSTFPSIDTAVDHIKFSQGLERLARVMDRFPPYDVSIDEVHHVEKKDAPSGTAITLAEGILKNLSRKKQWTNATGGGKDEIEIQSFRIDDVPGTHLIKYFSPVDDIEIKHTAHTREGFAIGAVMVAEWIRDKQGVLNMDDFLKF